MDVTRDDLKDLRDSMRYEFGQLATHLTNSRTEITDRLDILNGKVGKAHDRVAVLEGAFPVLKERVEVVAARTHDLTNKLQTKDSGAVRLTDLRMWVAIVLFTIGGTLTVLQFFGKL